MFRLIACLSIFATAVARAEGPAYDVHPIALSGTSQPVTLDYFAWDAATRSLWVPAGNLERVVVIDGASGKVRAVPGFASKEFTRGNRTRRLGPSSATVGDGAVFVGSRADASVTAIDPTRLERGAAIKVSFTPDGIAYVAATREIWVTGGPPEGALAIIDASQPGHLVEKDKLSIGGSAEGYAVDEKRGAFFTNVEETGETAMIDVRKRAVIARWKHGCDSARGIAIDVARGLLFVACLSRVVTLDIDHGGKPIASIDTGDGLDNIDYSPSQHLLYAAAGKAGTLAIARVDDGGKLSRVAVVQTTQGARSVVVGDGTTAYVIDPAAGRILVVTPR